MSPLYDKHGNPRTPFTAVNTRGQTKLRNFTVSRISESTYECDGCGQQFYAMDLPHYSLAVESKRLYARNKGMAMMHASHCQGTQPQ